MPLFLLAYAFVSNVALAVVPHEPVVIWYGAQIGVWSTALVATLGTVAAAWVDHRVFVPMLSRVAHRPVLSEGLAGRLRGAFTRAPFAILAVSGVMPLPSFPFKAMAFASGYPLGRYLAAVAAGRMPRYLLLAGVGVVLSPPPWMFAVLCLPFVIPPIWRAVPWRKKRES